jgi:hypothetical protein
MLMKMTQQIYTTLVDTLDKVVDPLIVEGMTESEAEAFLKHFIQFHYFPVSRAIRPGNGD